MIVAVGGSATTDGGLGAVEVLRRAASGCPSRSPATCRRCSSTRRPSSRPQKGATPAQVEALSERLAELAARYRDELRRRRVGAAGLGRGGRPGRRARSARRRARPRASTLVAEQVGLDAALDGRRARDHRRGEARPDLVRRARSSAACSALRGRGIRRSSSPARSSRAPRARYRRSRSSSASAASARGRPRGLRRRGGRAALAARYWQGVCVAAVSAKP